ncbi:MAG: DUF3592 domain-containing protein [Clostridiales bacterium]|nr:DUF3592 domain-containing protein [Clostridiales bacterium]
MSEDRFNRDDRDDAFANNRGVIKSWKQLIIVVGGFLGAILALIITSAIPGAQWLTVSLVGLIFLGTGITFLKVSRTNHMLPLLCVALGAVMIFFSVTGKFFPDFHDSIGDRGHGVVMIVVALFLIIYPIASVAFVKNRYKESVEATVVRVDSHYSRSRKGHHSRTYRPVYEFTYSGRTYTVMNDLYSSGSYPMVGDVRELLIDENDPERFYDIKQMKKGIAAPVVIAVLLIAIGVYLVVAG